MFKIFNRIKCLFFRRKNKKFFLRGYRELVAAQLFMESHPRDDSRFEELGLADCLPEDY